MITIARLSINPLDKTALLQSSLLKKIEDEKAHEDE
jgi:hypothetical protein